MTAWMVPMWDCSCSRQLGRCLFGTIHLDDSLDGAYLGPFTALMIPHRSTCAAADPGFPKGLRLPFIKEDTIQKLPETV